MQAYHSGYCQGEAGVAQDNTKLHGTRRCHDDDDGDEKHLQDAASYPLVLGRALIS